MRPDEVDEEQMAADENKVRRGFWPKLRRVMGQLPFAENLVAAYYCALDPATPKTTKAILLAALAYFVVPLDVVPDFLALIGFGDDAAVLFAAYNMVAREITAEHRERARMALEKPANQ
jgi:uncharacterized membrane protein YkvA (DUF1232 family)